MTTRNSQSERVQNSFHNVRTTAEGKEGTELKKKQLIFFYKLV
jgi:hypothetical protein